MNNIDITVANRIATANAGAFIVCDNKDYSVTFAFDAEWDSVTTKTCRIYYAGEYDEVIFEGDTCVVPPARNTHIAEIGVFTDVMTTTPASVQCKTSILSRGGEVADPSPDVYAQLIRRLDAAGNLPDIADAATQATAAANDAAVLAREAADPINEHAPVIDETTSGSVISVSDAACRPLMSLSIYGKTTQDGTPTPDAPIDLVSVVVSEVAISGKNLFDVNTITTHSAITNNGDGTLSVSKVVSQTVETLKEICPLLKVGDVATLSITSPAIDATNPSADLKFIYITGAKVSWKNGQAKTITQEMLDGYIYFYSSKDADGNGVDTLLSEIQVELGEAATAYEPYIEAHTLETPHTLPGIPVSSGGNYTDENGQRWICDEVDFARGVYVQRVERVVFDGSDDENWNRDYTSDSNKMRMVTNVKAATIKKTENTAIANIWCNMFIKARADDTYSLAERVSVDDIGRIHIYSESYNTDKEAWKTFLAANNMEVVIELETPIETALSDAELAQYAALAMNYPNTTILNDAGAGMLVKYAADTKTWILKQITALNS